MNPIHQRMREVIKNEKCMPDELHELWAADKSEETRAFYKELVDSLIQPEQAATSGMPPQMFHILAAQVQAAIKMGWAWGYMYSEEGKKTPAEVVDELFKEKNLKVKDDK